VSKRLFVEHFEVTWNQQDAGGIERFIAPDYRGFAPGEIISGIDGYKEHFRILTTGFPDLHLTIEDIRAEADRVVARWFVDATHAGDFAGLPPTGRPVHVTGMTFARFGRDRIVEEHENSDTLGLMRQIGVIPEPPSIPVLLF